MLRQVETALVVGALLAVILATAGIAAAPRQQGLTMTFGDMTLTVTKSQGSWVLTYTMNGTTNVSTVSVGRKFASLTLDGTFVETISPTGVMTMANETKVLSLPQVDFQTTYWWDNVYFVKGYPVLYPHPNRDYYQIYASREWATYGTNLLHFQIGAQMSAMLLAAGPVALGAAIGAYLGAIAGGTVGAVVGAAVGGVIGAILAYVVGVTFQDEANAIWWWVNKSLISAMAHPPWWVIAFGMWNYWASSNLKYLRTGSYTEIHKVSWTPVNP